MNGMISARRRASSPASGSSINNRLGPREQRAPDGHPAASRRPKAAPGGAPTARPSPTGRRPPRNRLAAPRPARAAPRTPGCRARSSAGTSGPPGTHSQAGRFSGAMSIPSWRSNKTRSATAMRPSSGRSSPASMLTTVVLPAPERPNRAVIPLAAVNRTSSGKAGGRRRTSTSIAPGTSVIPGHRSAGRRGGPGTPRRSPPRAPARSRWSAAGPRRPRRPAPGSTCRARPAGSGSRRRCSTRR